MAGGGGPRGAVSETIARIASHVDELNTSPRPENSAVRAASVSPGVGDLLSNSFMKAARCIPGVGGGDGGAGACRTCHVCATFVTAITGRLRPAEALSFVRKSFANRWTFQPTFVPGRKLNVTVTEPEDSAGRNGSDSATARLIFGMTVMSMTILLVS